MVDDDNDSSTFQPLSAPTERVLLKSCKRTIQANGSSHVSRVGFFGTTKVTKAESAATLHDGRAPSFPITPTRDTFEPRRIPFAFPPIGLIETGSSFAQVGDAIIGPVTIDVINPNGRPVTMNEEPSQPMCSIGLTTNGNANVSPFEMSRDATSASAARQTNSPAEDPSAGAITENPMSFSGIEHSDPHQQDDEKGKRERCGDEKAERDRKNHGQYVQQRLMDIASFEQRMNGKGFKR